jgi:predicted RNase H-like nuclease (RuvC/YqgF family)
MPNPKGEPKTQQRLSKAFVSEVQEFQTKKGIKNFEEAMKLRILADRPWKEVETERKEKIEQKIRKEHDGRIKNAVESYVKRVTELQNTIEASNSENEKLKWRLKAIVDKIPCLESEIIQKDSEIAELKAEIEKGPSPEIMKEHSEMKERIQSLESNLNEARKGKTESPSFYDDDDWLPEYWPFANMEEYKTWFESE